MAQKDTFYCGERDHAFGKAGCSGVAPSEHPLCFPLDTWDGLDRLQEVHLLRGVLDRGSTRKNVIFSNILWTNSEYPNLLKNMFIWS